MEVMGLVFQHSQAKGSSTSKEVEVVAKEEPMMEERLRKMLSKDLTKEEEEDYINMFKRYPHLFITDYSMIKGVDVIQHHIDLKLDAKPVAQKLRRLEALLTKVNKLLKAGFIYPVTNFEWVSLVVVTPKKNGKWRVCVDYKPLNAATKRDHFPLPFQDEILNEVVGYERYIVCDGYSGYYQIRIAEEDQHKTIFITPWGFFAFRVMPFGLTNAPSTFTRFTSFIFQPFFGKSIRVFLNDFCTYSDRALRCQRVEEGLQRLYQYGGQLNPDKCHVAERSCSLRTCDFTRRSYLLPKPFIILTVEHNLPYAIQHMSISSKISKWILELQEYEYTFIVKDSTRSSLVDVLTYKVKEKKITPKAQVKLDLSPQGELEDAYTLLFDGAYHRQRNKAAGGFVILNEEKKEVLKKGIQLHLAHSNNEAEHATLKASLEECKSMGIKRLLVKGDALLIVRHVQGTWACKNSKLLQWLHEVKLLMKDFEAIQIQHISRQHNKEADNMANSQFEVMVGAIKFKEPIFQGQETMEDILYFLETGECPKHLKRVQRHCLVRKALSYQLIGEHGIDAIGPLPCTSTGKQYILTVTDYMTRWAEAASVARITATNVSKFVLDYICSRFGTPLEILSDRGPGFRTDLLDALLENLSIKHVHSTPYYSQCNGLVEKTNGVLCKIITKRVRDRPQDWDKHLTAALWAYRTSFKVFTQFTPYHLVYGQEALLPIEVELGSLRVLARETASSKEKLEQRILDLQRLELDREAATDYYITQANKKRE
ncbi:hypothetical protein L7F22_026332 [Adiantum nelumboides]|nr:hypothetical protein [Adiantum nelumboides]